MKKILCKVTSVKTNTDVYGEDFFKTSRMEGMPKVGQKVIREREDYYPFKVGGRDGESCVPNRKPYPLDKNGEPSQKSMYYTYLEQIRIIEP